MITPLAYRMRPKNIDEIIGQEHLVGEKGFLRICLENDMAVSCILFGPPGSGKTTIAEAFANSIKAHVVKLNAVTCTKKDIDQTLESRHLYERFVIVLDEVHRLNKDKQDLLLPYIESGEIILIGATTANPYLALNRAIRSRCHLLEVKALTNEEIIIALKRAISSYNGLNNSVTISDDALLALAKLANGDLRFAYNILEVAALTTSTEITLDTIKNITRVPNYILDKDQSAHYDSVSALQKSIRGSDVDAALYYLARLIVAGDLESIARRLIITAYEDVGLANPAAVNRCYNAIQTAREVGFPEASIPLGFTVCELALSPKSKASNNAIHKAIEKANETPLPPLDYLLMTPVNLSEEDSYPYNRPDIWEKLQYLPMLLKDEKFYIPSFDSKFEQALNSNYVRLSKIKRTTDVARLKKENKD
ncbi:MAG: replication-associated recombination protein A [Bacilli bacterium]|jgi:putative ATPase